MTSLLGTLVSSQRWSGGAASGSARVCNESSEGQNKDTRETDNAGSLLQPPFDDGPSAPDSQQTGQSRRYPSNQDDVAQDAERLWRAGCRCHRDQDETKGDSDRSDDVERAGRDEVQRPNTNAGVFTTSPFAQSN